MEKSEEAIHNVCIKQYPFVAFLSCMAIGYKDTLVVDWAFAVKSYALKRLQVLCAWVYVCLYVTLCACRDSEAAVPACLASAHQLDVMCIRGIDAGLLRLRILSTTCQTDLRTHLHRFFLQQLQHQQQLHLPISRFFRYVLYIHMHIYMHCNIFISQVYTSVYTGLSLCWPTFTSKHSADGQLDGRMDGQKTDGRTKDG